MEYEYVSMYLILEARPAVHPHNVTKTYWYSSLTCTYARVLYTCVPVERPLHSLEQVLAVQTTDSYLCLKQNTLANRIKDYVSVHVPVYLDTCSQ